MAEKKESKSAKESVMVVVKIVLGVVFVVIGLWAIIGWWDNVIGLVKGSLGIIILLAGAICFAIAKE